MHWAQSKRIGIQGMKCLAYKRSSSIKTLRRQFNLKRMAQSPETQTYAGKEDSESLLGSRNSSMETGIQEKKPKRKNTSRTQGPDGLLAWAVAFANFLINLAVVGLGRMSGILYVVLMKKFRVDRKSASMPFSVQQAARNLFGPLAGILGQKYGVRSVTVVGGIIGVISAVTCYFATNMDWITVMWGLVFGICTALTTTLNQVPIDQYFEKHRTTAGGLAFSGGCVGAFFFPVVLDLLITHYGISGTFLAMGVIILVVVPAALFLGEPPWKKKVTIEKMPDDKNYNTFRTEVQNPVVHKLVSPPTSKGGDLTMKRSENLLDKNSIRTTLGESQVDFAFLRLNCETVYQLFALTILTDDVRPEEPIDWTFFEMEPLVHELEAMREYFKTPPSPQDGLSDSSGSVVDETTHSVCEIRIVCIEETPKPKTSYDNPRWLFIASKLRELSAKDESDVLSYFPCQFHVKILKVLNSLKTLSSELQDLAHTKGNGDHKQEINSPSQLALLKALQSDTHKNEKQDLVDGKANDHSPANQKPHTEKKSNSFLQHLKTAILLHKNPLFLLICLCRGVFMLTFIPMVTIVVDFAVDQGLRHATGKYMIAVLSLGDLLGRLCLGWVTDSGCINLSRYMLLVMLLLGGSTASLPYMTSEVSLMPAILVFGMLQGSLFVRHQILVSKYMREHEQAIGMGFINLLSGFIGFTLPYYIGYFRDSRGSYNGMLYVNGIICACVGLLWLFEPYFVRFSPKGRQQKYEELVRDTGIE